MSMRMLYMDYEDGATESITLFKMGDEVIWECEDNQIYTGNVCQITSDEITVYFPEIRSSDTFYLDGRYTKFEKIPSLNKLLPKQDLT